jgi:tetratricopeptide (TPR) repeat protein
MELSAAQVKLGNMPGAIGSLELALEKSPGNRSVLFGLAGFYQKMNDTENQLRVLDMLLEIDDDNPEIYFQKGLLLGRIGRFEASARMLKKAVKIDQDRGYYHFFLGVTLRTLGDRAQARMDSIRYYQEALSSYRKARELGVPEDLPVEKHIQGVMYQLRSMT